jgi:hypothetical protein
MSEADVKSNMSNLSGPMKQPTESNIKDAPNQHSMADVKNKTSSTYSSKAQMYVERWGKFSTTIVKQGYWSRLGNLTKSLTSVPDDIASMYNAFEAKIPVKLNEELRLMYYTEFTRIALGSTTVHFRDVETLIHRKNPDIVISKIDFLTLMTSKLHESSTGNSALAENNEYFDFEHFLSLLYDLLKYHADVTELKNGKRRMIDILRRLPLDPESGPKQAWDIFCLFLLLYCSFSIPFSIAFDDSDRAIAYGSREVFETLVDIVFMTDIFLNFVTAYDNQGYIVRDFYLIANHYLQTWFIPDFAGTFPFDKVITAFIDTDQNDVSSSTLLRGLKLIRMLKLIRAIKFTNKLEKLKQNEGYEGFGTAISLISATFILFFTAHMLGCVYTIIMSYEEGDNWLLSYDPQIVNAGIVIRYTTSLYWAMITIRFLF